MSYLVESLKRLYLAGKVTDKKLGDMMSDGKISYEDYMYITWEAITDADIEQ